MCEHGGRIRNEIRLALETGIKRKHQCHVKGLGSWKDFEIERGGGGQGLAWKQLHRRQRLVDECRVSVVAPLAAFALLRPPAIMMGPGYILSIIFCEKAVCWCFFSDIMILHYNTYLISST